MKRIRNEKGGIFVELTIFLAILFTFHAGAVALQLAAGRRFEKIVEHRNETIEKIRGSSQLLPRGH